MDSSNVESAEKQAVVIREITSADLKPIVPRVEGTAIVFQCNVPDFRGADPGPVELGQLTPEGVDQERVIVRDYFTQTLSMIPPEERKDLSILVVGGGTKLLTEKGLQSDRKRGMETAEIALSEAEHVLREMGLSEDQIINKPRTLGEGNGERRPAEIKNRLQDVDFLRKSPEYATYLKEKYGTGTPFWIAFEEMFEEGTRQEMDAEGPEQIADRVNGYLGVLVNGLKSWHQEHPGKRVLAWVVSHRDNMEPFFKIHVSKTGQTATPEDHLNIKKGGGIVIEVDPNGVDAKTNIQDHSFSFQF